jgi:hypothetical protein
MISLLTSLLHNFICYVETGVVLVINALIVAIGALLGALLLLLPTMPSFPTLPSGLLFVGWLLPLSSVAAAVGAAATLVVLVIGISAGLRWVRAIR